MSDSQWQERVTHASAPAILVEHRVRYRTAAALIETAPVWADLGCGNGIAAAEALGEARPPRTLLVDAAGEALAVAERELAGRGVETLLADLASEQDLGRVRDELVAGGDGGVVTCFEVMEHLPTFLPLLELLKELALRHGFTAVLSVPNDAFWSIENPFHATIWGEGAFEELRRLLPADHVVAHQVALQGSIAVLPDHDARAQAVDVRPPQGPVPTHFLVAFGPRAAELGQAADVAEADLVGQRRWERQRESDLAHLLAVDARLAEYRAYVQELEADRPGPGTQRLVRLRRRLARRAASKVGLMRAPDRFEVMARLAREGPTPLVPQAAGAERPLKVAILIPDFQRGSGGMATILSIAGALGESGHACSLWFEDPRRRGTGGADAQRRLQEYFATADLTVHEEFDAWDGADVAVATGWETVARALLLSGCGARAYLVQDYEPDFFPASAESRWAEDSYTRGLHHLTAGPWLADLLRERFGASTSHFELGVDHDLYRPRSAERRPNTVVFYARRATSRRAVPLGLLALAELHRRRPDVDIVLFGEEQPFRTSFPCRHVGVLSEDALAELYSEATVGMSLSLTNYSRVSQEMMACGLPCVELDGPSVRAALGNEEAIALAPFDPLALAGTVERLLDDAALRERQSEAGRSRVASRTWQAAAEQVERGLREALAGARTG